MALLCAAGVLSLAAAVFVWRRARRMRDFHRPAAEIDRRLGRADGRGLIGWELAGDSPAGSEPLKQRAVALAAIDAASLPDDALVDRTAVQHRRRIATLLIAAVLLSMAGFPRVWRSTVPQWVAAWHDHPPHTLIDFHFTVTPPLPEVGDKVRVTARLTHSVAGRSAPAEAVIRWVAAGQTLASPMHREPQASDPSTATFQHDWPSLRDSIRFCIVTAQGQSRWRTIHLRPAERAETTARDDAAFAAAGRLIAQALTTQPSRSALAEGDAPAGDESQTGQEESGRNDAAGRSAELRRAADTAEALAAALTTEAAALPDEAEALSRLAQALQAWADAARRAAAEPPSVQPAPAPPNARSAAAPADSIDSNKSPSELAEANRSLLATLGSWGQSGSAGRGVGGEPAEEQVSPPPLSQGDSISNPLDGRDREAELVPAAFIDELQDVPLPYREWAAAYFRKLATPGEKTAE